MSARLRQIARDTVAITETGSYHTAAGVQVSVGEAVRAAVAATRHYPPDAVVEDAGHRPATPVVEVSYESTLMAARRLGPNCACLVFASAKHPGGGFRTGAKAQEESIARASALYPCLLGAPDFYQFHREQRDLRYSDRVIYSPHVPVFRDDNANLLDQPYLAAFLTAAAPNLGAIRRNQPEHISDVPAILHRRARRVLQIAAAHGHRALVLGAWGCGVFRNDPATVATAFADALAQIDRFDHVVFAVRDRQPATPVYATFLDVFSHRQTTGDPAPAADDDSPTVAQ